MPLGFSPFQRPHLPAIVRINQQNIAIALVP